MTKTNAPEPSTFDRESPEDVRRYLSSLDGPLLSPTEAASNVGVISLDKPQGYADVALDSALQLRETPFTERPEPMVEDLLDR